MSKELKEKQLKFINENTEYYCVNPLRRRNVDKNTNKCKYSPYTSLSEGCMIGRNVDKTTQNKLDEKNIPISHLTVFLLLPKELQELGSKFLRDCQRFHDCSDYWTDDGLSKYGKERLEQIKENINKGYYLC